VTAGHATLGLRFLIAFVLLTAAIPKLRNRTDFLDAVENYRLLPQRAVPAVGRWLPWAELVLGIALLIGLFPSLAAAAAAAAFALFAGAVAINLARGREIECGCLGASTPRRITWRLVVADLLLAAAAVAVVLAPPPGWAIVDVSAASGATATGADALALLLSAACLLLVARLGSEWLRLRAALRGLEAAGGSG
jgi:uncharacterized membrane protein YphA (DoxX/SURF4 family)